MSTCVPDLLLIGQVLSHVLGISGFFEPVELIREVPYSLGIKSVSHMRLWVQETEAN